MTIKEQVRRRYGGIARSVRESGESSSPPAPASCCSSEGVVNEITFFDNLYATAELTGLPETVTEASLGCGNPHAIAGLQPGESVLDLGSGGGIDCFIAAQQVGPTGQVIGLDMTPDMLALANENRAKMGLQNVEFRQGEIENMPLDDESVDVIISNCVINLSPDKDAVFSEAFRVLKPGGRLAVSDIVTQGDIPEPVRQSLEAWVGCIAGALDEEVYLQKIRDAGFTDVRVESRDVYGTEVLEGQTLGPAAEALLATIDPTIVQGYAAVSAKIVAYKPR
ncbi:MAG: arsenite methyltransferase [Chloroflexi bacterium]|nr:arsenite methyltransferase [Chloroflexota bacterium]